ncbi:hypothetical protein [Brachybacterium sp. AOP3-A1-3]|uniref:hypothetical protein n=1 Tax=Brachybacterium sp. AOP3-A1-3 TaxID=3457699 RepID=UPI0040347961
MLLLAALVVGLPRLLTATVDPESVATDFLQAIVDGDLEEVREHVEHAPDASGAALTAEILGAATDRLDSFTIDKVDVGAGTATVTATLASGSEHTTTRLTLTSHADSAFAPVGWELAPVHLPEFLIDIPLGAQEIRINGVALPLEDLMLEEGNHFDPKIAVQLLPGTYEITLAAPGPWQDDPAVTLEAPPVLGTWRKPVGELQPVLNEAGHQEVRKRVDELPQECPGTASDVAEDCPFTVSDGLASDAAESSDAESGTSEADPAGPGDKISEAPGIWVLDEPMQIDVSSPGGFLWSVTATGTATFSPDGAARSRGDDAPGIQEPVQFSGMAYSRPSGELRLAPDSPNGFSYTYCDDPESGDVVGIVLLDGEVTSRDLVELCEPGIVAGV